MAMTNPIQFIQESIEELKKLTWPSRESVIVGTVAVFVFSAFFVLYTMLIDFIASRVINFIVMLLT